MSGRPDLFSTLLSIGEYPAFRTALAKSGCERCGLHLGRTRIVVDRGRPSARIMAIGEGPGANEDATGLAFVGRGGKLFDRLMAEAGYDTDADLLIANVVKCRPPDNRVPKASEAKACLPLLLHQVRLVSPRVVILLGATALKHLFPARRGEKMRDVVGRPFSDPLFPGVRFVVFYHPAFLLRNPGRMGDAAEHVRVMSGLGVGEER